MVDLGLKTGQSGGFYCDNVYKMACKYFKKRYINVCVFACELLHKVGQSDSCVKMDKIFITKQNNVYRQTISYPLVVKDQITRGFQGV
jgi:hypothetical protein